MQKPIEIAALAKDLLAYFQPKKAVPASTLKRRFGMIAEEAACYHAGSGIKKNDLRRYLYDVVVPHKVAVFEEGMNLRPIAEKLGIDWDAFYQNLLIHDLSKFDPAESIGYCLRYYLNIETPESKAAMKAAWHHHKNHNPHHPEYWHTTNRDGQVEYLYMPPIYQLEMIADWQGAGRTYGTPFEEWVVDNIHEFAFHEKTAREVADILRQLGFKKVSVGNLFPRIHVKSNSK